VIPRSQNLGGKCPYQFFRLEKQVAKFFFRFWKRKNSVADPDPGPGRKVYRILDLDKIIPIRQHWLKRGPFSKALFHA
jgi:hypothetical protein